MDSNFWLSGMNLYGYWCLLSIQRRIHSNHRSVKLEQRQMFNSSVDFLQLVAREKPSKCVAFKRCTIFRNAVIGIFENRIEDILTLHLKNILPHPMSVSKSASSFQLQCDQGDWRSFRLGHTEKILWALGIMLGIQFLGKQKGPMALTISP